MRDLFSEETNGSVAFSAFHDEMRLYVQDEIIRYTSVFTNVGDHFQLAASMFICPFGGLYVFRPS